VVRRPVMGAVVLGIAKRPSLVLHDPLSNSIVRQHLFRFFKVRWAPPAYHVCLRAPAAEQGDISFGGRPEAVGGHGPGLPARGGGGQDFLNGRSR
jgi:hypothetical protein